METEKNELEGCLNRAMALVEDGAKSVVSDLGFEKDNLEDLVPSGDEATRSHLGQLDGLVNGLRKNLSSLKGEITAAQTLVAKLKATDPTAGSGADDGAEREVDLSPSEASEMRHDGSVTLGSILRSLFMANEPAQRERAEKENP